MTSLTMLQRPRADGIKGHVQAKIEPSNIIADDGIFVEVNSHFDLADTESSLVDAMGAVTMIEKHWETARERAAWIADQIMALTESVK